VRSWLLESLFSIYVYVRQCVKLFSMRTSFSIWFVYICMPMARGKPIWPGNLERAHQM
jgi:hypothetical protein